MLREDVYGILAQQRGQFVSGQSLSDRLCVSRAAVWKAVEALRRSGCTVEARSGLGYRLTDEGDALTASRVAACLTAARENIVVLDTTESTNDRCKALAAQGASDGTVVMAGCQTAGRGRLGRTFLSPADQGLYLSVLWRPDCPPESLLPLTALTAVAVSRAVERLGGTSPDIKWPNDLVLNGRKVCGILTELSVEAESGHVAYVVAGMGVNCRQRAEDFPPELRQIAGSLDMALPERIPRAALAAAMIEELDELRQKVLFQPQLWLAEYRRRCLNPGRRVILVRQGVTAEAEALDVDESFGLVVRHDNGMIETLRTGEVSVRGLYGYAE